MQKTRISNLWPLLLLCVLAPLSAFAIGFGSGPSSVPLGQPLDFSVSLRLEPGESLDAGCVRAEVNLGDAALPSSNVSASLVPESGGGRAVRVRTQQIIEEPVVVVQVSIGCGQGLSRRFVVFADPPMVSPAAMQAPAAGPILASAVLSAVTPAPAPAAVPGTARAADQAASAAKVPAAVAPPRPRPPRADATRAVQAADRVAAVPRARLRLESGPPPSASPAVAASLSPEASAAIEQANEAVKAAVAAASASQSRIAALEASVQKLNAGATAQRDMIETLRARAESAESEGHWTIPLGLAMLALLGLSAWLYVRLRELERDRQQAWLAAARSQPDAGPVSAPLDPSAELQSALPTERPPAPTLPTGAGSDVPALSPLTPISSSVSLPKEPAGSRAASDASSLVDERNPSYGPGVDRLTAPPEWLIPDDPSTRTQALPQSSLSNMEIRAFSAEELIDLEQQAEFFVVLGQDDAAIDLLVSHLRDSGGASPLPYLKLLDIYRRLGDRPAYERTRDRFSHRFNAKVPGWDKPAGAGRALEEYPDVIARLQRVWPKPLDAMADMESMLFRKDGGELFELPAYRDLLLLYALARFLRDLDGEGAGDGHDVDVLLPLNDVSDFEMTAPISIFGIEEFSLDDGQNSGPVDLDLNLDLDLDLDVPAVPPDSRFGQPR